MTEIAMNNKFERLECDDDVVLLYKDTFKVGRFKELVNEDIKNKWRIISNYGVTINDVSLNGVKIPLNEIQHTSPIINCQLLKIASTKGWQKGKLRIKICISPNNRDLDKLYVEFCSDEPNEPESPLDDMRKMINSSDIKSV